MVVGMFGMAVPAGEFGCAGSGPLGWRLTTGVAAGTTAVGGVATGVGIGTRLAGGVAGGAADGAWATRGICPEPGLVG